MDRSIQPLLIAARTISSTLPYVSSASSVSARPVLRLVSGSSDDADLFVHRARTSGAVSTVGASLGCDWTVRAAGVPGVAFALRDDGGTLSICPARDAAVFVDGRRELPLWRSLRVGSRVDVGLLRIEVVSGPADGEATTPVTAHKPSAAAQVADRGPLPSVLGVAEDASLDALPLRFPWVFTASLSACGALYLLALSLLD